eukprot:COSAG01_NODE_2147_length_8301_cov_6.653621_4_plen_84_part_00
MCGGLSRGRCDCDVRPRYIVSYDDATRSPSEDLIRTFIERSSRWHDGELFGDVAAEWLQCHGNQLEPTLSAYAAHVGHTVAEG